MPDYATLRRWAGYNRLGPLRIRPIEHWPAEVTPRRVTAPFSASWEKTARLFTHELLMLGARDIVVQLALDERDLRMDGLPYATTRLAHPGVVVTFASDRAGGVVRIATDRFTTAEDNLRAVALALEALRKVDRYGVTSGGEQYTGWLAIEPPNQPPSPDAAAHLLIEASGETGYGAQTFLSYGYDQLRRDVWRAVVRRHHPDAAGRDIAYWRQLVEAKRVVDAAVARERARIEP
jgi:hypothetical protein